ncbi:pyruvate formate lyase-activating protein [Vallitalea pronyensis]|uniref:Pyruvate formate-lyase-activating enzyme n=1 Tax=Vallitalea pronyensis TaxID=1348613 RepID=A0A8J8MHB1_9FIRM|nr:pyruvate formate-lyase-activating protein [Vallitalea pronyensis]QUI21248.1 pyruvate formate lyase-activating protein [Vallitalea pronyensis]
MDTKGKIHSIETCGTVDGPGIRFVIFMQGCPLRCKYCHNPDTWKLSDGEETSVEAVMTQIKKYTSYMKFSGGGVTVTGGEPLLQPHFVKELLKRCKEEQIHTALDTSGYVFNDHVKEVLDYTDLVLLDIKCYNKEQYQYITSVSLDPTLNFMQYLSDTKKSVWIRYVLVPGLSDKEAYIDGLGKYLSQFDNIDRVELLPFHKMGEYKWEELGLTYELKDTQEPTDASMKQAMGILKKYGLNVMA